MLNGKEQISQILFKNQMLVLFAELWLVIISASILTNQTNKIINLTLNKWRNL